MIDIDTIDLDAEVAYCTDGSTRNFHEMYDADSQPTSDVDQASVIVIQLDEDSYAVVSLDDVSSLH